MVEGISKAPSSIAVLMPPGRTRPAQISVSEKAKGQAGARSSRVAARRRQYCGVDLIAADQHLLAGRSLYDLDRIL